MHECQRFRFGPFVLDVATFRLLKDGTPVPIEPKALDLLRALLERAPRLVEKPEIFAIVWKDVAVTDNALTRVVAQLRRTLGDDPKAPRYIETVATRGYRFCVAVIRETGDPPAEEIRHAAVSSEWTAASASQIEAGTRRDLRSTWSRAAAATIAIVLLAILWLGYTRYTTASANVEADAGVDDLLARVQPQQLTIGKEFDGYVAFAPDGRSFAYSSDRSGALEIYVQGTAPGSTPSPLTDNGRQNVQPAWSPDGEYIAYHEMAGNGLWIVPSRGGSARKIADFGSNPAWSPDGRRIAFQSLPAIDVNGVRKPGALSTIWIVEARGGAPVAVTSPGEPAGTQVAPKWLSSSRLVFANPTGGDPRRHTKWWSVDANGGGLQLVSDQDFLSADYALTPDRRRVYFVARSTNTVWWMPLDERGVSAAAARPTGLPTAGSMIAHLTMSPDGRRLAWTVIDSTGHIWEAPLDEGRGRGARAVTEGGGIHHSFPSPSSDGRLAIVGSRHGVGAAIHVLDPEGGLVEVTTDPSNHTGPQWMPGERELAVVSDHDDVHGFWAIDPATARERLLFPLSALVLPERAQQTTAAPAANIAIAPDFTRLAMSIVKDGVPNLWIAPLQDNRPSGPLVQRTFERDGATYPQWSPDGRWLAYQCAGGSDTHVCVIGAQDGERIQLTHEPGQSWVGGWSPDSAQVLFAARRSGIWNVATVSRTTSAIRMLTSFTDPRLYVRYPRWDAANSRVVFGRSVTRGRLWTAEIP